MPRQLGGDSPVRLIEVESKRSIGDQSFKFWTASAPSLNSIHASANVKLFNNILHNRQHSLFPLLPSVRDDHYFLCGRSHDLQL